MNFAKGPAMAALMGMRTKLANVRFEGKAGNDLVTARFKKTENFVTVLDEIRIHPDVIKQYPDRVEALVKEAVNNGLGKEIEELTKIMPKDGMPGMPPMPK